MAIIVTSIGSNSSIDTETPSSCSGSFSPYDVTFSTTPSGVSVGDRVEITDEGVYWATFVYRVTAISGSTYTLAYVTDDAYNGDASPCELVDSWYNQSPATFKRFYSSISNWESNLDDTEVYSSGDAAVGECHNDSVFAETVNINGGSTVGLASVKLSVESGSRHDGTAGTGARMIPTTGHAGIVTISRDDVTVEWLEIDGVSSGSTCNMGVRVMSTATTDVYVRNLIIHDIASTSSSHTSGVYLENTGTSRYVMNNFVYDISRTSTTYVHGISASYSGSGAEIYCNTVLDIDTTNGSAIGIRVGGSSALVKDNIVLSVSGTTRGDCYYTNATASTSSDYNLSDDTTAWGSNSITSSDGATAANTIVSTTGGSEDLHLKSGSLAVGSGVDLGTTPTGVEIDIDGRDRDAQGDTWDIGADQSVGLSVTVTPAAAGFELAALSPTVTILLPSVSIAPAASAFELAADNPTVVVLLPSVSIAPDSATFEVAASSPDILLGNITVASSASVFELAADNPTIGQSSVIVTPAASAFVLGADTPAVGQSSVSITPAASAFELAADNPSLITPLIVTPSAATVDIDSSNPNILLGSISLSPPTSSFLLSASDASSVMGSVIVGVGEASFEVTSEYSTVGLGSITVNVTPAAFEVDGQVGSIVSGSVSITPASGSLDLTAKVGGVVAGSIIVVVPEASNFDYAASNPSVGLSSMTVDVSSAAFDVRADTPAVVSGSITISPVYSVVEIDSPDATIYAGYKLLVDPAQFVVELNPFVLRITMDSASIGYACTGALDYDIQEPTDYNLSGVVDYNAGVLTLDYAIQRALDYRYDHTS